MPMHLSEQQQAVIDPSHPTMLEVVAPRTEQRFKLIPAEAFDFLADAAEQDALARDAFDLLDQRLAEEG